MATTYNNCQMGIVDASGNLSVIYPQTKANLVSCDSATYGGSSNVTNVQSALNNLSNAFNKLADMSSFTSLDYKASATTYNQLSIITPTFTPTKTGLYFVYAHYHDSPVVEFAMATSTSTSYIIAYSGSSPGSKSVVVYILANTKYYFFVKTGKSSGDNAILIRPILYT